MNCEMRVMYSLAVWSVVLAFCIPVGCSSMDGAPPAEDQKRPVEQLVDPAEIDALIDRAEHSLRTNAANASDLLSDSRYLPAHGWPRFRDLIKAHATGSTVTIVTPQEPGKRLRVHLRLVEVDGSASAGALVYFYHTGADGDYGPNDAKVPLAGSDNNYARLFGYATTDSDGTIKIETIRPGGYPDTTIPAHIHLRVWQPDKRSFGNEIWFEDDPRINSEARDEATRFGIVICPVVIDSQGQASIDAEIKLD